ncbi:MAG: hypothetical protein ABI051_11740 [Vicinamibacterales bacterium]
MSVTHFIPSGLKTGRHAQPRAISAVVHFSADSIVGSEVTAERPLGVGAPSMGVASPAGRVPAVPTVSVAMDRIARLERQAKDTARAFRWSRVAEGDAGLSRVISGTPAISILATSAARRTGAGAIDHLRGMNLRTGDVLALLGRARVAEDWAAVTVSLERAYLSTLQEWRRVFETMAKEPGANDPGPSGHAA